MFLTQQLQARDEVMTDEIKRVLNMQEGRIETLHQQVQECRATTEKTLDDVVKEVFAQKQGNLELAEAQVISRQWMRTEMTNSWGRIQDQVLAVEVQVRMEIHQKHMEMKQKHMDMERKYSQQANELQVLKMVVQQLVSEKKQTRIK